ncbi:MAG: T9SS type A sorting domain-containing protein [Saprospiraceae bacterium]
MKNLILFSLLFLSNFLHAQFLINGDFEIWNPVPNVTNGAEDPYYWTSTNIVYTNDSIPKISKSTDAYSGNYALRMDIRRQEFSPQNSHCAIGYGQSNALAFIGLFDANDTISFFPEKLVGYYRRFKDVQFEDSLEIWAGFLKEITIQGIPHGLGYTITGLPPNDAYEYFEMPLMIPGNQIDSVQINILFSTTDSTGNSTSYILFDNLDLIPRTVSTQNVTSSSIKVYPNPATDYLYIENKEDLGIQEIRILNINGQVIKQFKGKTKQLNIQDIPAGTYIIQLYTEYGIATEKIVIK